MKKIYLYTVLFLLSGIKLWAVDTVDVRPPLLSIYSDCGDCIITATDNRKITLSKDSFQLDVGIRDIPVLLKARSNNYEDIIIDAKYTKDSIYNEMIFELKVKDKYDTAFAVFFVYDNANNQGRRNYKYDSVKYYPQLIDIDNNHLNFGQVYIDSIQKKQITIKNVAGFDFLLKNIALKSGKFFRISNNIPKNFEFIDNESLTIDIEYTPKNEISQKNQNDFDTLIISNECLTYKILLQGQGVVPRIIVEDFDFDICEVGKSLCKEKISFPDSYDGLQIYNSGTGILKLKNYLFFPENTPFKLLNPDPDPSSSQLFPNTSIYVKPICFQPTEPGEFFTDLIISNNSNGPDSIARLRGIGYNKGPYIKRLNFGELKVLRKEKKFISIKNSDNKPYYLYKLELSDNSVGFRIMYEDMSLIPSIEKPIAIYPENSSDNVLKEYLIPIEFMPLSEGFKEIKIFPKFIDNGKDLNLVLFNYIRGIGIQPIIELMGHFFDGRTLVNTFHKDTGFVTIFSKSQYADLLIKAINIYKLNSNSNDFIWLNKSFPQDTIIKRNTSIKFPILFKPEEAGDRILLIQVISDAIKGNLTGYDTSYAQIKGFGYNKILSIDPLNFIDVIHCDSSIANLVVRNISDTATTEIYEMLIDENDSNPFEIDKSIFLTKNIILKPRDTIAFEVKFKPYINELNNYSVMVRVLSNDDTSTTFIRGNSIRYKVNISSDTISNGMPGMLTLNKIPDFIGNDYNFKIYCDNIEKTHIDSIYMELVYRKNDFRFMNYIQKGSIIQNWNINFKEEELNKDTNVLKILCYGLSPITENGVLFTPAFVIMLGDTNGVNFEIRNVNFYQDEYCNFSEVVNGFIKLSYCGEELRKIQISSHFYGLTILNSNPTNDNFLKIAFNVALTADTKIEVFNQYGISIFSNDFGNMIKGRYFNQFDISSLSSGVYFLKFKSGPYTKTEKFIISK